MDLQITINATPEEARAELARFLDSGEYPQTKGTLCRIEKIGVEGYCCLGVASEIGAALGLVTKVKMDPEFRCFGYKDPISGEVEETTLGPRLREFFGMTQTGMYDLDGRHSELTNQNDHEDKTFAEIAHIVRQATFATPSARRW